MSERKKLCYIITGTDIGGSERHLLEVAKRIDRRRYAVSVISLKRPGEMEDAFLHEAIPVYTVDLAEGGGARGLLRSMTAFARLFTLLRRMKPDLVHTLCLRADVMGRMAARLTGVPRVIGSLRIAERGHALRDLAMRLTSSAADVHVAVSQALAREAVDRYGIHPRRVRCIPNGIDLDRVIDTRPANDLPTGGPVIGTLCRPSEQKGTDVLLDAVEILVRYHPELRLIVAGSGAEPLRFLHRSKRMGLQDHVFFLGDRKDVGALLAAFDVFVLPSRWEGMPNALLEAMGAGRPSVASRIAGVVEIAKHGETALLVDPGKPALLADAVDRLLMDRELAQGLGRAAQEHVGRHHLAAAMAAAHQALYDRLLGIAGTASEPVAETLLV